ncbi:MAG: carbohydrate porin [Bacteroidetes bacterium]|nr:carbohydrate porin [Bacteroidota bacterium]MBS1930727.1 carbohydrate porin [Bacteroidota bacterium]
MKFIFINIFFTLLLAFSSKAQDSSFKKWSVHFQLTLIAQKHSGFKSLYSGMNSLADSVEPSATSLTSTLFIGRKLWRGAILYFNPEVSGGKGLSYTRGVAGALNGETYRVGSVEPQVFVARAFLQQYIALPNTQYEYVTDDANQAAGKTPVNRITITAGKFAISDFYDDNTYSKDPRTQFFNWSIWANGAWDYPANTRGYTEGLVIELIKRQWAIRLSSVAVPRIANYHLMEYKLFKAHSETLEFEHDFSLFKRPGRLRLFVSNTNEKSLSYQEGLNALENNNIFLLNIISGNAENNKYGGKKTGIGINAEQQLFKNTGMFIRCGWNDGKYVSWAFTEIDNTVSFGFSTKGIAWKRPEDVFAIAAVTNGISKLHRDFLKKGGYGFIIGDGDLNYGRESIVEMYYSAKAERFLWVTLDYQYLNNPAYNKDRGPVHVFGIRAHIEF